MTTAELKQRTRDFAIRALKLADTLGERPGARACSNQLARCGTSVAANYRASCRARSKAEFIAKIGIVEEEADESEFWIDLIGAAGYLSPSKLEDLRKEAAELTRIMAASRITAVRNRQSAIGNRQ